MGLFGFLQGGYGQEDQQSQQNTASQVNNWSPEQQRLAGNLFSWMGGQVGQGATGYGGQLTAGANALQRNLFDQAQQYQPWQRLANPEAIDKAVAERVKTRRSLLAPLYSRQEAGMKEQMANMGLTHSSPAVQALADVRGRQIAEEDAYIQNLYDNYERMGMELAPQAMATIANIGQQQRAIEQAGLTADFQEWLRQQPEYSPLIQAMLGGLGIFGQQSSTGQTTGATSGTAWGMQGGGQAKGPLSSLLSIFG